ncbi:unnamed protein product, partial [marine sediment metagenome]
MMVVDGGSRLDNSATVAHHRGIPNRAYRGRRVPMLSPYTVLDLTDDRGELAA